jgi:hypothetical protein
MSAKRVSLFSTMSMKLAMIFADRPQLGGRLDP